MKNAIFSKYRLYKMGSILSGIFPGTLITALASGAMVMYDPFASFFPSAVPQAVQLGIHAGLGALIGSTVAGVLPSVNAFDMKQKERFVLSSFIGTTVAALLGSQISDFGGFSLPPLAAFASIFVTAYLPDAYHIIR